MYGQSTPTSFDSDSLEERLDRFRDTVNEPSSFAFTAPYINEECATAQTKLLIGK